MCIDGNNVIEFPYERIRNPLVDPDQPGKQDNDITELEDIKRELENESSS
jgi:hypothetical protein